MKYNNILIILFALLAISSCEPHEKKDKLENVRSSVKRSDLVGKWRMSPLPAIDPPIVVTFSLSLDGELKMSSDHKTDATPSLDPYERHGYWHYAKLDETHDILIFRELKRDASDEISVESFQVFEVSLDGDDMVWKPLKENSKYDWLVIEKRTLKRIK